ncbi:DUF7679 family protein [Limosilactobacillus caccae]|uniref:DUF7679 family protein n=1 Tax=Limosilactobacillus caccae TaxID=1926284 RepID=UPI0009702D18|nr:hypothetical protein [Limosilactobacillus caccae]
MAKPDTRDWSFAKAALYELESRSQTKKKKKQHHRREYYWVQVRFLSGKIANYQLPKDLQEPLDQHRANHRDNWQSLLLGALINVPTSRYRDGQAKIRPAEIKAILILPVRAHDPRWITRSQFVKPDYSWGEWLLNRVSMHREGNFLTHDFDSANQQRIKTILSQYRQQRVKQTRQRFFHHLLLTMGVLLVAGLLIWL